MTTREENHIIMVDDNEIDSDFIRLSIETSSIANPFLAFSTAATFLNHMELVHLGRKPMPAAVLLDINMPQINGYELYHILRGYREFKYQPKVIFYSHADSSNDPNFDIKYKACFQEKFSKRHLAIEFLESLV